MQRQKGSEQTDPINLQETLGENSTNLLNCRFFQSGLSRWVLVILAHRQLRGAIAWEMHDAVTTYVRRRTERPGGKRDD